MRSEHKGKFRLGGLQIDFNKKPKTLGDQIDERATKTNQNRYRMIRSNV